MKWIIPECVLFSLILVSCKNDGSDTLAPYTAERPLFFTRITQNSVPDIQWLGGRVMALGVNRGNRAALDSTLVWITTATENSINSYVTFGSGTDAVRLSGFGGSLADSLESDSTYTFWMAQKSAFDARLDTLNPAVNPFTFCDTLYTSKYWIKGQSGGEGGTTNPIVRIKIRRFETAARDSFVVSWTPSTSAFKIFAVRVGTSGGWDALLWQIATPAGMTDNILPPISLGVLPDSVAEVTPWTPTSFTDQPTYTVWMANRSWGGSFTMTARGYAWFRFSRL